MRYFDDQKGYKKFAKHIANSVKYYLENDCREDINAMSSAIDSTSFTITQSYQRNDKEVTYTANIRTEFVPRDGMLRASVPDSIGATEYVALRLADSTGVYTCRLLPTDWELARSYIHANIAAVVENYDSANS